MEILISALPNPWEGLSLTLKNNDKLDEIAVLNGNKHDFKGPVLLTKLDADVVYGMSRQRITSRIIADGPQLLITTKELAHKLYEHGMKAAYGKIKVGNNPVLTCLETFYRVKTEYSYFKLAKSTGVEVTIPNYFPVLLTHTSNPVEHPFRVDIDKIQTQVTLSLKPH